MFPFDIDEEMVVPERKEQSDYEIDFRTGQLTGRIITGLDAIKQWVRLVLCTDRYYFPQYSWNYGGELATLIGKSFSPAYVKSEVKRMVKDALLVNEDILDIENIQYVFKNDRLTVSFTINTIYGRSDMVV